MSWRYHGRVRVSSRSPRAAGICDRCGFAYNHNQLSWQYEWAGTRLQNLRILVCSHCEDVPQEQLRAKILSPDPLPIPNARPEPFTTTGFSYDESNVMVMPDGVTQMLMPDGVTVMLMPNNPTGN